MRYCGNPAQLALFGPQPVHIARDGMCALCRVSLAVAAAWDRLDGCHDCPGWVEPAPPWALLTADEEPEYLASEAAA